MKDVAFLSSQIPGTQQIRLDIGHALFGARIEFGDPLFITISPSTRHSALCIRLSRYRRNDPAIADAASSTTAGVGPWTKFDKPKLYQEQPNNAVVFDVPDYKTRKIMVARDPWAVVLAFKHSLKYCRCARCVRIAIAQKLHVKIYLATI